VAEVPRDGVVAADDPRLVFYGRWSRLDPKRPVASWGPVVVKVRFEGTSLSLALEDEQVDLGEEGRGNIYQFSIDGGEFQRLPPPRRATFQLATGLAAGEHEAMLVRRTESKWGTTTFVGFQIDDGARVLPAGRPPRSIEVFGDSISAGLANENTGYYTNETENGYLAFGPLLARRLDAEWRVEARGGGSLYNDFYLPMIPFFDRVLGPANEQNAPAADNFVYSFAEHQPDVLILALGTNDFSEQYPHLEQALYVAKYRGFVQKLRGHYPGAVIFCLAPFKPGAPWDEARTYIAEAVDELADAGVVAVDGAAGQAWLTAEEYVTGDAFHPNLAGHEKIAERLEPIVRAALGW
jgi:lysophospholipase L1-like esterase